MNGRARILLKDAVSRGGLYFLAAGRAMAVWTLGLLYLAVVLMKTRAEKAAVAQYLRQVLKAGFLVEREWAAGGLKAPEAKPPAAGVFGARLYESLSAPGRAMLLEDARVRALQETIVAAVFRRLFGLDLGRREKRVLSRFSSVAWICSNMARAAGSGKDTEDQAARNRLVFPIFMKAMELHVSWLSRGGDDERRPARRRKKRSLYRFSTVGEHGEITGCLYPEAVTLRKRYLEEELRKKRLAARRLMIRTAGQRAIRDCGVAAICLAATGTKGKEQKTVQALRSLKAAQNLYSGGIPWETGLWKNMRKRTKSLKWSGILPKI